MGDKKKTKVLIVDDEVFISEQLNLILLDLGFEVTDMAYDAESAIASLKINPPEIAILDIQMHGRNQGFEIAKYIKTHMDLPFIFLTSFADKSTVEEASGLTPEAYLLKPFNEKDIFSTLNIALKRYQKKVQYINLKIGHEVYKVKVENLLYIKSFDKYIEIYTKHGQYLKRDSIQNFIEANNLDMLIRVHRSYAVNINRVDSVKGQMLIINEQKIPISDSYFQDFKKEFLSI